VNGKIVFWTLLLVLVLELIVLSGYSYHEKMIINREIAVEQVKADQQMKDWDRRLDAIKKKLDELEKEQN
jgi:hypothetical protein